MHISHELCNIFNSGLQGFRCFRPLVVLICTLVVLCLRATHSYKDNSELHCKTGAKHTSGVSKNMADLMDVAVQLVASQLVTGVLSMSMDAKVPLNAAPWFKTTENQGFNSKRASWPPRARTRKTVCGLLRGSYCYTIINSSIRHTRLSLDLDLLVASTPQDAIEWYHVV